MDIWLALNRIEELENKLADLYEWLSNLFSEDKEIKSFFYRISLDEISHRDLVRYQKRTVKKNPGLFPGIEIDLDDIQGIIAGIDQFRTSIPTIEEALKFLMAIEKNSAENYFSTVMMYSNKDFASLINNLSKTFREHHKEIKEFAVKYGIYNDSESQGQETF